MKKVLLILPALIFATSLWAQSIFFENFSSGVNPTGWQLSSNTDVHQYFRPPLCVADTGLQTPAVGKNAPSRLILPSLTYDAANNIISLTFKVFAFDANLNCSSVKDSFPCPTYVTAMLIKTSYTGGTNRLPDDAEVYTKQSYRLPNAHGANTIIFNGSGIIPDGGSYRIYLDFKTAENTNCTGQGIKFIFDDFSITKSLCEGDCNPVANSDYFDGNSQNFMNTFKGNVYGGYLNWASVAPAGYEMKSLSIAPAVNDGLDYDNNNHPLSQMQFVLVTQPQVVLSSGCSGTPSAGTLTWNGDGTFEYTRTDMCVSRISFTYKIIDPTALESNIATVIIDFVEQIPLPVSLYSFTAERDKNVVELKWQTASENNSRGFYVQRNTGNGWENRAFVFTAADNGNSTLMLTYEFNDANSFNGVSQYRLAQIDIDRAVTYSLIKTIRSETVAGTLQVYPNPSLSGSVNVLLPNTSAIYKLSLFDVTGRKIKEWQKVNGDLFTINSMGSGVYLLRATDLGNAETNSVRIVVTR